tara:strand:+ start:3140 stop:3481 length:342 start_codon:yes stop_codon:yes gene_type:complete
MYKEFNSSNEVIVQFCGEYPSDFENKDISSDPNFVFKNDPTYAAVKLFDIDGNSVFVNSFFECQHYVKGGWDYIPLQRNESFYHNSLFIFSVVSVILGFVIIKKYFQVGTSND